MAFVRMAGVLALLVLATGSAWAQGSKLNDAQIAHIAYTADQIDIQAGQQALEKSNNKEVRAFAQDMVRDHTAVNEKALALVKKLNVTPEDNSTSQTLSKQAAAKSAELAKLSGAAFDKAYIDNEVAYHKAVNDALQNTLIPGASNSELKGLLTTGLKIFQGHQQHAEQVAAGFEVMFSAVRLSKQSRTFGAALLILCAGSAHAAVIQIKIENLAFTPAQVSAQVGDTIEWTNADFVAHTATARDGTFDIMLPPNATGSVVLKTAGTIDYYCKVHPNMTARITVSK